MTFTIAGAIPGKKITESSFGERLQSLRKTRGLTQVQLEEAAETTQRSISYYETEASIPPAPAVISLAKALHVTTDDLPGLKPPKFAPVEADCEARRHDQKAVVRLIYSLVARSLVRKNGSAQRGERHGR